MRNLLLIAKDRGISGRLVGRVLVQVFFLDDAVSAWTQADCEWMKRQLELCKNELLENARAYHAKLTLRFRYASQKTQVNMSIQRDMSQAFHREIIGKRAEWERLAAQWKAETLSDEVAVMFCVNKKDVSYSMTCNDIYKDQFEYAVIFAKSNERVDRTFLHELLHLFGAQDLYIPQALKARAEVTFPTSVMLNAVYNGFVDELSAYAVGWRDEPSPEAQRFLDEFSGLTLEEYKKERNKRVYFGEGTIQFEKGEYRGGLFDGSPYGQGTMRFKNGAVHTGEWDGLQHGKGQTTYASGLVLKGRWEHGKCVEGTFYYPDGGRLEGAFEDGRITRGTYYAPNGTATPYKQ